MIDKDPESDLEPEKEAVPDDELEVEFTSVALQRILDEVRSEEVEVPRSYNRTHNRHNR